MPEAVTVICGEPEAVDRRPTVPLAVGCGASVSYQKDPHGEPQGLLGLRANILVLSELPLAVGKATLTAPLAKITVLATPDASKLT
jgi:hypothetical protein